MPVDDDGLGVNYDGFAGDSLLTMALGNGHLEGRVAIANRLLDDGADVTIWHPLHALVGQNRHDFAAEPPLLQRLLDLGADVNAVVPNFGAPLETAAVNFQFSDRDLTPFYDVRARVPQPHQLHRQKPARGGRPQATTTPEIVNSRSIGRPISVRY